MWGWMVTQWSTVMLYEDPGLAEAGVGLWHQDPIGGIVCLSVSLTEEMI